MAGNGFNARARIVLLIVPMYKEAEQRESMHKKRLKYKNSTQHCAKQK